MKLLITILLLLLANCFAFSHQDRKFSLRHDNVHVSIWGGEEFPSKAKLKIAGTLAAKLCESYGYMESVYIELNYTCVQNCANSYLMSFDNGAVTSYQEILSLDKGTVTTSGHTKRLRRAKSVLVLRLVDAEFDMTALLNILEYGLKNTQMIAQNQQLCDIHARHRHFSTNSTDTSLLRKIANTRPSSAVKNVLATKVQVGKSSRAASAILYSFHDDGFRLYADNGRKSDAAILSISSLWTFYPFSSHDGLFFDSDSSFYYVDVAKEKPVSRRHILYQISCWGSSCVTAHRENKDIVEIHYVATSSPLGPALYKMGYYPANDSLVTLRSYRQHH